MLTDHVVYTENLVFDLAEKFIKETSRCIFLTGKAGTGKTTFLRHIKNTTRKNTVVVAPTGVAAINAGGTTIHSFFQLPFTPFVPFGNKTKANDELFDRYTLLQNLRIESEKRSIFRKLELLIIDEVSMVRCDILDAIDIILRHFRRKPWVPFGGVQVLFIGDLFQLPPVVQNNEWAILRNAYQSPFFFDAHVMRDADPLYIELKKIFRQSDPTFISLLNRIRNNETTGDDIDLLNERYRPDFRPSEEEGYITLTTHNARADKINQEALDRLMGDPIAFQGDVEGDFPERNFPTDRILNLKPGAQIMFIKNDTERIRRYYNGKVGIVRRIEAGKIIVSFPGEYEELEVTKESWRNVRYSLNHTTHQVEEEILGIFTQYAIRLAWAITIHKSQGLTFDKVIIDAGSAFSPGQVYVALSRCTSMEGIILFSKISRSVISSDERVLEFAEEEKLPEELQPMLNLEQQHYKLAQLLDIFDWTIAMDELKIFRDLAQEKKFVDQEEMHEVISKVESLVAEQQEVTRRFFEQMRSLVGQQDFTFLLQRVEAGVTYFTAVIDAQILLLLADYEKNLATQKRVKKVRKTLNGLIDFFRTLQKAFSKASILAKEMEQSFRATKGNRD
jgi:hypothetical protein